MLLGAFNNIFMYQYTITITIKIVDLYRLHYASGSRIGTDHLALSDLLSFI